MVRPVMLGSGECTALPQTGMMRYYMNNTASVRSAGIPQTYVGWLWTMITSRARYVGFCASAAISSLLDVIVGRSYSVQPQIIWIVPRRGKPYDG
jgi:hypothetical protein